MKLTHFLCASFMAVTFPLSGCGNDSKLNSTVEQTTTVKEVENTTVSADAPTYEVAIVSNFEPYAYRGDDRNFIGFNIDIIDAVGQLKGFNVNYVEQKWSENFNFVTDGRFDLLGSIVAITPEREKIVDFTPGYVSSTLDFAVSDEYKDKTFDEILTDNNIIFSVMENTITEDYLTAEGIPADRIVAKSSQYLAVGDIYNGNADVAIADSNMLKHYSKEMPGMNIIKNSKDISEFGFVVKKGNTELLDKLNDGLATIKGNGTYDEIYKKWFN